MVVVVSIPESEARYHHYTTLHDTTLHDTTLHDTTLHDTTEIDRDRQSTITNRRLSSSVLQYTPRTVLQSGPAEGDRNLAISSTGDRSLARWHDPVQFRQWVQ